MFSRFFSLHCGASFGYFAVNVISSVKVTVEME